MKLRDLLLITTQRFKVKSMRILLTMIGMGIGIGTVFFLFTLGLGVQRLILGDLSKQEALLTLDVTTQSSNDPILQLSEAKVAEFENRPDVSLASPIYSLPINIKYGDLNGQTLINGIDKDYFRLSGTEFMEGEAMLAGVKDTIVASSGMLRLFGLEPATALGERITIDLGQLEDPADLDSPPTNRPQIERRFTIVGVIEDDTNFIYAPIEVLTAVDSEPVFATVKLRVETQEQLPALKDYLVEEGYTVFALTETLDQLNRIFRITQTLLISIGMIALAIASIGMFNTLTISLLERTKEIGIMKAIGATDRDIWKMFLFESIVIGLGGGIAGIIFGYLGGVVVNLGLNQLAVRFGGLAVNLFHIPLWFVGFILLISFIIGFMTGVWPARRAAKQNPLDSLRNG